MDKNLVVDALADLLLERAAAKGGPQVGYKHDLPTGYTLMTNYMHGSTGIFGTPGLERDVFATVVQAQGIASMLKSRMTVDTHPIQPYLTGFTDESGTEATEECDECVKAGEIKSCLQGTVFGRICRDSQPLEVNRLGQRQNRGEFTDLQLVNPPTLPNFPLPNVPKNVQGVLNNEVAARLLTMGFSFSNKICEMIWTGNPLNNTSGGYAEFYGYESLVKTGHTDILTGTSCPSLDSDIKDANYLSVHANAFDIYYLLQMIYRYVSHNARTMGFMPVQWVWVMQDALFRILCDYWPCVYATSRCGISTDDPSVLQITESGMTMKKMADEMYNGRYLLVDGVRLPVVLDDCLPYDTNATNQNVPHPGFASDIYLLPLTVRGGRLVNYLEFFDYRVGTMPGIRTGNLTSDYWTDEGRFLWTTSRTRWCVEWTAKTEPRLRLLTPHLAGRLENVVYNPLQPFRMPDPDDSYFVDGGDTYRSNNLYTLPAL